MGTTRATSKRWAIVAAVSLFAVVGASCDPLLGIDDYSFGGTSGTGAGGTTATSTMTGGTGGTSTSLGGSSGGSMGTTSTVTGSTCGPGTVVPCYDGPAGTENVGNCKAGTATCKPDGTGYESCQGATKPETESCVTPDDEDCDGLANEEGAGCICVPGSESECPYSGPPATKNVGACKSGNQVCDPGGLKYGACAGEVLPIVDDCTTPVDENCDGVASEYPGCHVWSRSFGDISPGQSGSGIAVDPSNNVIVTGELAGTASFGGPTLGVLAKSSAYVAKFAENGTYLWSKAFTSAPGIMGESYGRGVTTDDSGNVYITGSFSGKGNFGGEDFVSPGQADLFIVKMDAAGNHLWSSSFGAGTGDGGAHLATIGQEVLVVGNYGSDGLVIRLDSSGNQAWVKNFHNVTNGYQVAATGVAVDSNGNAIVVGTVSGTGFIDFGCGAISPGGDTSSAFVVKLSSTGQCVWSKRFSGPGGADGGAVMTDAAGNAIIVGVSPGADFGCGALSGGNGLFVTKLTPQGGCTWTKHFPGAMLHNVGSVASLSAVGDIVVTGYFVGAVDFGGGTLSSVGAAMFVLSLDASGNHLWSHAYDGMDGQYGRAVATGGNGDVFLTGQFASSIDFGGGPPSLVSVGQEDIFLAHLTK